MQTKNNGGDVLARGGIRARFGPAEGVSDKKWNDIFGDYNPETSYIKPKEEKYNLLQQPEIPKV
jgi:hypothetical protein